MGLKFTPTLQLLFFCVEDYGEQSNQGDTRRPITMPPRRLSDGLNARRLRAVACEGQARRAVERHEGPKGSMPNWDRGEVAPRH